MPKTTDQITVDPGGVTMTVDILDRFDVSVTAYTASGGGTAHTLPLEISSPTAFHLTAPGDYTVSAKVNGSEVAGGLGDTAIVAARHGVPVTHAPRINAAEFATLLTLEQNTLTHGTAFTQTYSTAARTVPDATYAAPTVTAAAHTFPASGNLFDATPADLLINVRDDTTANAVADVVVNEKSIAANLNQTIVDVADTNTQLAALAADVLALKKLINALIDDGQAGVLPG